MNDANAFFSAPSPHTTTKPTTKGNDAKLAEYDGIDTPVRRTAAVATARDLFGSPGGSTNVWTPHRTVAKISNANVNTNHNVSSYDASSSSIDNGIVNNDVMATMDIRKDDVTTTDNRNKNDDDNNDTIMSSTENDHRKNVYDSSSSDNSIEEEEEEEESYEEDSSSSSSCSEVNDGKTSFERALMVRRSSLRHMNNDLQSQYRQQQQQHVYPKLEDNGGQQRKSSEPAILQEELSLDHTTNANAATANRTATMRSADRDVNENIATADALTNPQNNTGPTSSKTAVIPTALTLPLPFIQNHNHSTTTNASTTNRVTPRRMLNLPTPPRRVFTPKSSFTPLSSSTAAINSSVATGGSGTRFKVPPPLVLPPKRTITPLRKRQEVKKVWSVPVPTPVKDIANPQPQELEQSHRKAEVSNIASASTLVHHDSNEASSTKQQQQHVVSDDTDMAATKVEKVEEIPAVVSIEAPSPNLKAQQSSLEISNKTESVFPAPPIAESNSLSKKHHEEQKEDNIFCGLGADHSYPSTTDTNNNTEELVTSCDVTTYQTYLSSVAASLENITPSIDAPPAETVVKDVGNELITTTTTAIEIEEPEKKDDVFVEIVRNPPEFEQYDEKEVVIQNTILNSNDEFIHELPPSHWTEHVDPSTNQVYYYNSITGMTTWDKPIELNNSKTSIDDVVHDKDEFTLKEKSEDEDDVIAAAGVDTSELVMSATHEVEPVFDVIEVDEVCNDDVKHKEISDDVIEDITEEEPKSTENEWTEHVDPSTNQVYYYNSITGMTTWDKPIELESSTTLNDNVNMQEKVVECANDVTHPYAYPQQQQPQRKHRANHGRPAHAICHIQFGYTVLMHTLPAANLALTSSSVGMTLSSVGGGRRKDRVYLHRLHTLLKNFDVLKVPHPSKSSASTTFTSAKPGAISENSGTKGTMIHSRSTSDKSVLERIIEVAQDNAGRLRCTSATATSSQPGTISMPMHPRVYSILQHYASKPGPTNITTQSDTDNNNMVMVQYYLHNNQFPNAIQTLLDMEEYTLALLYTFAYTHSSLATSSSFGPSATKNAADSGIMGEEGTVWHMCLRHIFTQDIAKRTILTNHNDDATGLQLQLQALQSICSLKYLQDIHYFTHASSSSSYVDLMTRFISKVLSHSTMDVTDNSMNALASTIAGIVYEIVRYGANVSHWEVLLRDLGDALLQALRLVLHNRKISSLQIQQSNFNEKEESSMHSLNSLVEWAHVCYVLSGCKLDEQRLPLLYYFHYSTSTDDDDSDTVKKQQNLSAENEEGDIVNILPLLYHQSYSANVSNSHHSYNNGISRRTPLEVVPNIQKALDTTLQWEHAKRQGNIFCALPNLVRYKCQYLWYLSELGYFSSSATFSTATDKDVDGTYHIVEEYLRNVNDADVLKDRILVHLNLEPDAVRFYRSTKHDDMEEKEEKDKMKHLLRSTAKSILPDRISIPLSQQNQQQQQQSEKKQQQSMMMAMTPTPRTPIHLQQQQKQKQEQTSDTTTTLSSTTVVNLNANTNIHSNRKPPLNNSTSAKQLQQQSKSQNDQFVTPTPTPVKSMTTEKVEHIGANTTNNISMMGLRSSSAPNFSNTTSSNSSSTATAGTGTPKAAAAIPKAPLSTPISRASAPASATKSTSTPTTTSSSPSSNPLSNIKSWFIHKLHPNATEADVGDAMQAYYCKEQKRWIFPNEDADDANAALRNLGPPPTKTSSMNKKNTDTSSSPTDISSTPVPSSSLTNHPLNETTQGKEQVDALTALMAPPSMPSTRSTKSNNYGNKRMNNNTGGTAPKFAVFAPPPVTPAASAIGKYE